MLGFLTVHQHQIGQRVFEEPQVRLQVQLSFAHGVAVFRQVISDYEVPQQSGRLHYRRRENFQFYNHPPSRRAEPL
jgi:hypothetical protein